MGWALNPGTGVLTREGLREIWGHRHRQSPCEDRGRDWRDVAVNQEHQELEEAERLLP